MHEMVRVLRRHFGTIDQIALRWLDNYLQGIDTDVQAIPKVTQYALGAQRYETQPDWPQPSLAPSRLRANRPPSSVPLLTTTRSGPIRSIRRSAC